MCIFSQIYSEIEAMKHIKECVLTLLFMSFALYNSGFATQRVIMAERADGEILAPDSVIDFFDKCTFSTADTYEQAVWGISFKTYTGRWVDYMRDTVSTEYSKWELFAPDLFDRYDEPYVLDLSYELYGPARGLVSFAGRRADGLVVCDTMQMRFFWSPPVTLTATVTPVDEDATQPRVVIDVDCPTEHRDSVVAIVVIVDGVARDAIYSWYSWYPGDITSYCPMGENSTLVQVAMRNNMGWRKSNMVDVKRLYLSVEDVLSKNVPFQIGRDEITLCDKGRVSIYDMMGVCVLHAESSMAIDVSMLPRGMYILYYAGRDGRIFIRKFIH